MDGVQHAGLNPMGGRARAGCPWRNVQSTLDGLVDAGLTVAVYEELASPESPRPGGLKRKGLKTRALSQVVSPGSATYLMGGDVCLKANEDLEYRDARPYAAIAYSAATGYTLVTASVDARE